MQQNFFINYTVNVLQAGSCRAHNPPSFTAHFQDWLEMSQTLIVVDDMKDWVPYYPSRQVITFKDYLEGGYPKSNQRTRIINLCKGYRYLADGYYCSLLAEACSHHAIPSVQVINDLDRRELYKLQLTGLSDSLARKLSAVTTDVPLTIISYFGTSPEPLYKDLVRRLFELFPCPLLQVEICYRQSWEITSLKAISPNKLDDAGQTEFAEALNCFSSKVWRTTPKRKKFRYDMAILANPEEKLPPSDGSAFKRFIRAGRELGIDVELIKPREYPRLLEFDALFIRETTAINHHTYRFARKAAAEGLVVVDDPDSILRCTNKVYLADLFHSRKVPTPRSRIFRKGNPAQLEMLEQDIGYPMVIKIPDGSFSRGVVKASNRKELESSLNDLFKKSALLLAQEFLYTDFDWRIGIFNNKPLYACRYYMVKNHWQIYQHGKTRISSGGFDTLPTTEVPSHILHTALAATQPIGNGLYGVDVKEKDGKCYVIEVNDNTSIDRGVEDAYLGDELYHLVMSEFLHRLEERGN